MLQAPSLDHLKHEIRLSICATCKFRPTGALPAFPIAGSSCESRCAIFKHLADLREHALLIDPIFSRHHAVATRVAVHCLSDCKITKPSEATPIETPLTKYGAKVARIVAQRCDV